VSVPAARDPAGILIVALPLVNVATAEVYPPPESVTEPVGVGVPPTPIVTDRDCNVVMLDGEGVTVTVGVVFAGFVTVTVLDPVAVL